MLFTEEGNCKQGSDKYGRQLGFSEHSRDFWTEASASQESKKVSLYSLQIISDHNKGQASDFHEVP